ncbi:MAG: hypothetical protein ACYSVY_07670 [Planctomycetota bacterium]|jgi:hypothetical protein
MVGLVNAAGTAEFSRIQAELLAAARTRQAEQGKLVPLLDSVHAAERIVQIAVQTIEFAEAKAEAERHVPDGQESDRFDQAEQEANSAATPSEHLDVTA